MDPKALLFFVLLSLSAGLVGSLATSQGLQEWYPALQKPWFTPPSWVFAPAWTLLYVLMGAAAYLVWKTGGKGSKEALEMFYVQLALNALWSFLFFGLQSPLLALVELVALWAAVAATVVRFDNVSRPAALLMLPYLAWTTFAGLLNLSIWLLN